MISLLRTQTRVAAHATPKYSIIEFGEPGDPDYQCLEGMTDSISSAIVSYLLRRAGVVPRYKTLSSEGMVWEVLGHLVVFNSTCGTSSTDLLDYIEAVAAKITQHVQPQLITRASRVMALPTSGPTDGKETE